MFFSNLLLYRLTQDLAKDLGIDGESLAHALKSKPACACGSQELTTYGFIPPLGKGEDAPLVHESGGFYLVAARKRNASSPAASFVTH